MLQGIKEYTQGWIARFIIGLLILSFSFFGIHSWLTGVSDNPIVANVNGEKITRADFYQTFQRMLRQQEALKNQQLTGAEQLTIKNRALQTMIDSTVMQQAGLKNKYRVSPTQIKSYVESIPQFQNDGLFSLPMLQATLTNSSLTPNAFLNLMKNSLLVEQPHLGILTTAFVLPNEIVTAERLLNETRDIGFVLIPSQVFAKQSINIPDDLIQQYYTAHKDEFVLPEKISLDYLLLSASDVANKIKPSEDDLLRFYSENQQLFLDKNSKQQSFAEAKAQVASSFIAQQTDLQFAKLREQLANLSYEHPDSLKLAADKLNLPIKQTALFSSDQGVDEVSNNNDVRQIAFSVDVRDQGNNSNVITLSPDKVVVVRRLQYLAPSIQPLNEVKEKIIAKLTAQSNEKQSFQLAEKIKQKLISGEQPIDISMQNNLQWQSVSKTARKNPKINQSILTEAFNLPLLANNKPNFSLVKLSDGYAVVGVFAKQIGSTIADQKEQDQLQKKLREDMANLEYKLYQDSIFSSAKIKIENFQN